MHGADGEGAGLGSLPPKQGRASPPLAAPGSDAQSWNPGNLLSCPSSPLHGPRPCERLCETTSATNGSRSREAGEAKRQWAQRRLEGETTEAAPENLRPKISNDAKQSSRQALEARQRTSQGNEVTWKPGDTCTLSLVTSVAPSPPFFTTTHSNRLLPASSRIKLHQRAVWCCCCGMAANLQRHRVAKDTNKAETTRSGNNRRGWSSLLLGCQDSPRPHPGVASLLLSGNRQSGPITAQRRPVWIRTRSGMGPCCRHLPYTAMVNRRSAPMTICQLMSLTMYARTRDEGVEADHLGGP